MNMCTSVQKHRGWLQPQSLAKRVYEIEGKKRSSHKSLLLCLDTSPSVPCILHQLSSHDQVQRHVQYIKFTCKYPVAFLSPCAIQNSYLVPSSESKAGQ